MGHPYQVTLSHEGSLPNTHTYAVLAVVIAVVNLVLPGHVSAFCQGSLGMNAQLAGTIASVVNTVLAVVVSFPILKFWITPSVENEEGKNSEKDETDEGKESETGEDKESKSSDGSKADEK